MHHPSKNGFVIKRLLAARPPMSSMKRLSRATRSANTHARASPKRMSIVSCIHFTKPADVTAMSGYTIGGRTAVRKRQSKWQNDQHCPPLA